MSEEGQGPNVVKLRPDMAKLEEAMPLSERDKYLQDCRDEMLDVLNGLIGRVHAFDLRGMIILGFGANRSDDIVFTSSDAVTQVTQSVGALELTKSAMLFSLMSDDED